MRCITCAIVLTLLVVGTKQTDPAIKGDKGEKGDKGLRGAAARLSDILDPDLPIEEKGPLVKELQGSKGDIGTKGEKGNKGDLGKTGNPGKTGKIGPRGPGGSRGPEGPQGKIGPKGDKGERGVTSNSKTEDAKGSKGDKGERGDKGEHGKSGKPGPSGPQGNKGEIGDRGYKGEPCLPGQANSLPNNVQGMPGRAGNPGVPGVPGATGEKGSKGEPGNINNQAQDTKECKFATCTILIKTKKELEDIFHATPIGTLAFCLENYRLLIRTETSWQYIEMSDESLSVINSPEPEVTPKPTWRPHSPAVQPDSTKQYLRIAALNEPYSGEISYKERDGIIAADELCYTQSGNHNFKAFLTSSLQNIKSFYQNKMDLQVKNLLEELVFDSLQNLFENSNPLAHILSFNSKKVMEDDNWPRKLAWIGSSRWSTCSEWTSNSNTNRAAAIDLNNWLAPEEMTCDTKLIVLCVEISPQHKVQGSTMTSKSQNR